MEKELTSLLSLAKAGNEDAFGELTVMYKPLIESMAKRYAKKAPGVISTEEDFVQEATLAFYSAVCSYRVSDRVTFGLYAKVCIKNRLISFLRASAKKTKKPENDKVQYTDPINRLLESENVKEIETKVRSVLSDLEWSVFCLYVQKKSYSEMAELLGKPEKSVDNALYRIKKKLKRIV